MTEDLTQKLRPNTDDKLTLILMAVQDWNFRASMIERNFEDFAEKLDQRLQKMGSNIAQLQEGQKCLRFDLRAFRQHVDKQFQTLSGTVEGRYREHDQRITRLETNTNQANSQT